jgi:agmatinase
MSSFDPSAPAASGGLFGLPSTLEDAAVVIIPVPWEATVSYGAGTANGPAAVLQASRQVDLLDRETGRPYRGGIAMLPIPEDVRAWSEEARRTATPIIEAGGSDGSPSHAAAIAAVDALGDRMNGWVYEQARRLTAAGKLVGVLGGDHSVPYGAIRAAAEAHPGMGILHLDAHCDLRDAYEGFRWSHASIMFNVLRDLPGVSRIVQVGIRDYSDDEDAFITGNPERLVVFFDPDLRRQLFDGEAWSRITHRIAAALPREVYLSFDIDGLDPALCPHTGTPVLGGLSFPEISALMRAVVETGRKIVGLDLCEVAPDPGGSEWDGNVGARVLYKQIGYALLSQART